MAFICRRWHSKCYITLCVKSLYFTFKDRRIQQKRRAKLTSEMVLGRRRENSSDCFPGKIHSVALFAHENIDIHKTGGKYVTTLGIRLWIARRRRKSILNYDSRPPH